MRETEALFSTGKGLHKEDGSELFFVECKRVDTRDSLNEAQIRGLQLLSLLLNVKVFVCEIVEESKVEMVKRVECKVHLVCHKKT